MANAHVAFDDGRHGAAGSGERRARDGRAACAARMPGTGRRGRSAAESRNYSRLSSLVFARYKAKSSTRIETEKMSVWRGSS